MDIASSVSRLIAQVAKLHRARAESLLSTIGLHAGQEFVLSALWSRDGQTQVELARALAVTPPTVNRMVARMEDAGLVSREPLPRDPRVTQVFLTARGRTIRPEVEAVWGMLEAETLAPLDKASRAALTRLLMDIAQALGDRNGDRE